jgi:hypothetical protein
MPSHWLIERSANWGERDALVHEVSELEFELGIDPFAKLVAITNVMTTDDLANAYRRAMSSEAKLENPDDGFADTQRKAEKRRLRTAER